MDDRLKELKNRWDESEQRRRMAYRRVQWLEKQILESETEEEFDQRNEEIEQAIGYTRQCGIEEINALLAYSKAEFENQLCAK